MAIPIMPDTTIIIQFFLLSISNLPIIHQTKNPTNVGLDV